MEMFKFRLRFQITATALMLCLAHNGKVEGEFEENPTPTVMTTTQIITYGIFLPLPTIVFCMVDYENM